MIAGIFFDGWACPLLALDSEHQTSADKGEFGLKCERAGPGGFRLAKSPSNEILKGAVIIVFKESFLHAERSHP